MSKVFSVGKVSGKGRKLKFTVSAGEEFTVACTAVVSQRLVELMSTTGSEDATDVQRMQSSSAVWKRLLTEDAYYKILDWAEENLETMGEEIEALNELMVDIVEGVLPKAQK